MPDVQDDPLETASPRRSRPASSASPSTYRQEKATMCDLCSGLDGQPSCVYACPHDAAHRMSGEDLIRDVEGRLSVTR